MFPRWGFCLPFSLPFLLFFVLLLFIFIFHSHESLFIFQIHACMQCKERLFVRGVVTIIGILDMIFGELDGLLFFIHFYFCSHMLDFVDFVDMFKWIMLVEEEGSLLGAAVLVVAFIVLIILIWPQPIKGDDSNNSKKKRRKKKPVEDKGPIDPNDLLY